MPSLDDARCLIEGAYFLKLGSGLEDTMDGQATSELGVVWYPGLVAAMRYRC